MNGSSGTELHIGQALEQARKEQGLSLREIEHATKIRARYLAELEKENFDVLPAVYVRGSLKTYANYLQLDADAMLRELDDMWTSQQEEQAPAYSEPPESDPDRSPVPAGSLADVESPRMDEEDEEGAEEDDRPTLFPVGYNRRIYLGSGALLVLILAAVALALTLMGSNSQPTMISQVREPMASQIDLASFGEDERAQSREEDEERSADDESDDRPSKEEEQPDGSAEDEGAGQIGEQEPGGSSQAQGLSGATPPPSTPAAIEAAPATAEPNSTPTFPSTPASGEPAPPVSGGQDVEGVVTEAEGAEERAPSRNDGADGPSDISPGSAMDQLPQSSEMKRLRDLAEGGRWRQLDPTN